MHHSSVLWEITLQYFLSWNCTWLGQKDSIKVQNFRLSTAHLKLYQICTWISSFCWKYIKFQLKNYRVVMSHDTKEWCKIWKKDWLVVSKITRIWWILIWKILILKTCTLIGSFCAKYIMFDIKKYRGVTLNDTKQWCKLWRKTDS